MVQSAFDKIRRKIIQSSAIAIGTRLPGRRIFAVRRRRIFANRGLLDDSSWNDHSILRCAVHKAQNKTDCRLVGQDAPEQATEKKVGAITTALAIPRSKSLCETVLVLVHRGCDAPNEKGTRMQMTQSGVCKPGLPPQL